MNTLEIRREKLEHRPVWSYLVRTPAGRLVAFGYARRREEAEAQGARWAATGWRAEQ